MIVYTYKCGFKSYDTVSIAHFFVGILSQNLYLSVLLHNSNSHAKCHLILVLPNILCMLSKYTNDSVLLRARIMRVWGELWFRSFVHFNKIHHIRLHLHGIMKWLSDFWENPVDDAQLRNVQPAVNAAQSKNRVNFWQNAAVTCKALLLQVRKAAFRDCTYDKWHLLQEQWSKGLYSCGTSVL